MSKKEKNVDFNGLDAKFNDENSNELNKQKEKQMTDYEKNAGCDSIGKKFNTEINGELNQKMEGKMTEDEYVDIDGEDEKYFISSMDRNCELLEKHLNGRDLAKLDLYKVVTDIIHDSHPEFNDYDNAEKYMHLYFFDRGHKSISTFFRDEILFDLEEDFLNFFHSQIIRDDLEVFKKDFGYSLIADATNKLEQLVCENEGQILLKDLASDEILSMLLKGENDKNDMLQMLLGHLSRFFDAKMDLLKSQNEVAMVNENLNSLKEVCYTKDIDILSLTKELEPYKPRIKNMLTNQDNFILLLDYTKEAIAQNSKVKASTIIKNFCAANKNKKGKEVKGSFKSWDGFINGYSDTIKLITGEEYTTKIDALFAIEKHRDKVDMLFDVFNNKK